MSKIAILTDSSCDIPQEMAEKYGIDIMSFHILLDDVDYVERESCTNTEFYDKMRAAKGVPSTAAITPIQFCEKYCQYVDEGYTDVIHVPINKSGSSTYNNALMAQGMLREERPEHHLNIHLLDPHTYSMVFGWYLCEMGADTTLTSTFLKMGFDELSVSPAMILRVREEIRNTKEEE